MSPTGPTLPQPQVPRLQLYARLGFGALVIFGMMGSLTGHRTEAALVFVVVAVVWCLTRIVVEAIQAWALLNLPQPPSSGGGPPNPPAPGSPVTG